MGKQPRYLDLSARRFRRRMFYLPGTTHTTFFSVVIKQVDGNDLPLRSPPAPSEEHHPMPRLMGQERHAIGMLHGPGRNLPRRRGLFQIFFRLIDIGGRSERAPLKPATDSRRAEEHCAERSRFFPRVQSIASPRSSRPSGRSNSARRCNNSEREQRVSSTETSERLSHSTAASSSAHVSSPHSET